MDLMTDLKRMPAPDLRRFRKEYYRFLKWQRKERGVHVSRQKARRNAPTTWAKMDLLAYGPPTPYH